MTCRWACRRPVEVAEPEPENWWAALDDDVMGCLAKGESMEPAEIARRLGLSESAVVSLLALLVTQGRVRIDRVAAADRPPQVSPLARVA